MITKTDGKFQGFQSPNTTPIPDELFDKLLASLSGAELKVLLYICRRTFGFKKENDNISFNQICNGITTRNGKILDHGTGLSSSTAQTAIKTLTQKGVITATRRQSKEKGNEPTTYSLKFFDPYGENRYRGMSKTSKGLYRKSPTQGKQTVKHITVNGYSNSQKSGTKKDKKKTPGIFDLLPTLDQDTDKTTYVTDFLVKSLGDKHSAGFYRLVASHVPESVIRRTISEIKADGAEYPPRVFTNRMKEWAIKEKKKTLGKEF